MTQHFREDIAVKYGVLEAVVCDVIEKYTWLTQSPIRFTEQCIATYFPYAEQKEVKNAILRLEYYDVIGSDDCGSDVCNKGYCLTGAYYE